MHVESRKLDVSEVLVTDYPARFLFITICGPFVRVYFFWFHSVLHLVCSTFCRYFQLFLIFSVFVFANLFEDFFFIFSYITAAFLLKRDRFVLRNARIIRFKKKLLFGREVIPSLNAYSDV